MSKNEKKFTNFKIHTQYSICEGAVKIDELAEYCKLNKVNAVGICDSFNLCGALEFAEKLSKIGTQPLIGTQINILVEGIIGKISIFATNEVGYKNLTNLSSKSYLDAKETSDPHCILEDLIEYNDGLIILTGCSNSLFAMLFKSNKAKQVEDILTTLKNVFTDRIYIEIQRHLSENDNNFENFLIKQSAKINLPLIASQEVYYLQKNMKEAHDALICIGEKSFVDDTNRNKLQGEHHLKNDIDLKNLYKDIPEALENNFNFPLRFSFKPKKSKPILPTLQTTNNKSVKSELLAEATKGLSNRLENFVFKKNKEDKKK